LTITCQPSVVFRDPAALAPAISVATTVSAYGIGDDHVQLGFTFNGVWSAANPFDPFV